MPDGYHHLTYAQRCQISVLLQRNESYMSGLNQNGRFSGSFKMAGLGGRGQDTGAVQNRAKRGILEGLRLD